MTLLRRYARGSTRKCIALLASFLLLGGSAPVPAAEPPTAAIAGVVLDPAGAPAAGFRVIVRDTANKTQYTSAPADATGNYTLQVPVGGRYKLEGVIAADGKTRLPVQDVPPMSMLAEGTTRLNVRFVRGATPAGHATAAKKPRSEPEKKGGVPWYQRPGPIVGMVLGAGALAAIAMSGGSNASPSQPQQ